MKIFISADMEGITGQVSWAACGRPDGNHYDFPFARRMMTHDVNAAIRGARAAGAERVVIKDSHGTSRNLLIDELEPDVELISGEGAGYDGMMEGVADGFDAAMLVGYHGMAGARRGVMEHTIAGNIHGVWFDDVEVGEIGLSAAAAGDYGVPLVMIASDNTGCTEAAGLIPGIKTAITKYGIGRYMARCLHPSVTAGRIYDAAYAGVEAARAHEIAPWVPKLPATVKIEFNRSEEADIAARMPGVNRVSTFAVSYEAEDYPDLHRATRTLMQISFTAK
jgi:D-amino peptidase